MMNNDEKRAACCKQTTPETAGSAIRENRATDAYILAQQRARRNKRQAKYRRRRAIAALALLSAALLIAIACCGGKDRPVTEPTSAPTGQPTAASAVFTYTGTGKPVSVNLEAMAAAWAAEAGTTIRYTLTDDERLLVAQVVMAEAGGEPIAGMVAVAQCILNACELDDLRPAEAVVKYQYTTNRPEPSEDALAAVGAVFDRGYIATTSPILFFYNPGRATSRWHESQAYVMTINNHRFFAMKGE